MNTYFKILINSQVLDWRKISTKLDMNLNIPYYGSTLILSFMAHMKMEKYWPIGVFWVLSVSSIHFQWIFLE
jgi:hypothetical protein